MYWTSGPHPPSNTLDNPMGCCDVSSTFFAFICFYICFLMFLVIFRLENSMSLATKQPATYRRGGHCALFARSPEASLCTVPFCLSPGPSRASLMAAPNKWDVNLGFLAAAPVFFVRRVFPFSLTCWSHAEAMLKPCWSHAEVMLSQLSKQLSEAFQGSCLAILGDRSEQQPHVDN